jgi:hypothetical protein
VAELLRKPQRKIYLAHRFMTAMVRKAEGGEQFSPWQQEAKVGDGEKRE